MNDRNPAEPSLEAELSKPAKAANQATDLLRAEVLRQVRSEWPEPKRPRSWIPVWAFATAASACALALLLLFLPHEQTPTPEAAAPDIAPAAWSAPAARLQTQASTVLSRPYESLYGSVGKELDELGTFLTGRIGFVDGLMTETKRDS